MRQQFPVDSRLPPADSAASLGRESPTRIDSPTKNVQFQDSFYNKPLLQLANLDRSMSESLPNSPTAKLLPRPRSEKNVMSPGIMPRHTPTGLSRKLSSRIDPTQIPRPGKYHKETVYHTRSGTSRKNPPSVNAIYVGVDNGNCLPRHLRSTVVAPPCSRDVFTKMELPFCIVSTPFAELQSGEEEIPQIEFPFPLRCGKCQAYINPSVQFEKEGKVWTCNLCPNQNPVPDWYYCPLDTSGLRSDRMQRLELCKGSVEFLVSAEYASRDLHTPTIVFAVDVSPDAVARGISFAAIAAIQRAIFALRESCQERNAQMDVRTASYFLPQEQGRGQAPLFDFLVGVVAFSSHVSFFDVNLTPSVPTAETVKILSAEADDPFAPLPPSKWLFSLDQQFDRLDHLLTRLPDIVQKEASYLQNLAPRPSYLYRSCPSAVIKAMSDSLAKRGGKLYLFAAQHSTTGFGQHRSPLCQRLDHSLYGTPEEYLMYCSPPIDDTAQSPLASKYFSASSSSSGSQSRPVSRKEEVQRVFELHRQLGAECIQRNISVSEFFFLDHLLEPSRRFEELELSYLGEVAQMTGGQMFLVRTALTGAEAWNRLQAQLTSDLLRWVGSDSIWKLRTSQSLAVSQVVSAGQFDPLEDTLQLPGLSRDATALYELKVVADLPDEEKVHVQLAVLYTNQRRQRVVRVHNYTMMASNKGSVIFRNCDVEVIAAALSKIAARKALKTSSADEKEGARAFLQSKLVSVFSHYRRLCSNISSPKGQLILPESLKTLPMYALGLLKHAVLLENQPVQPGGLSPSSASLKPPPPPPSSSASGSNKSSGNLTPPPQTALAYTTNEELLVSAAERYVELQRFLQQPIREILNAVYPRVYSLFAAIDDPLSAFDENLVKSTDSLDSLSDGPSVNSTPGHQLNTFSTSSYGSMGNLSTGVSVLNDKNYCDKVKISHPINPSSENFESDQIYLLDDRSFLWLFVGRSVSPELLEEVFLLDKQRPHDRPDTLAFNSSTKLGRRAEEFARLLWNDGPSVPELRVIWADSSASQKSLIHKFTIRLVEDANSGLMSYVDFLCNLHAKMQGRA